MENIWVASWKHCDWVGKIDLIMLASMSIYSWAVIIDKCILFKRVRKANETFLNNFYRGQMAGVPDSSWSHILNRVLKEKAKQGITEEKLFNLIKRYANEEISRIGSRIDSLLTISAVAPFMGLLGTVWGILMAFHNIGITGTSSVSVIASGISEALIVTFVGLVVAIPAALGYNYLDGELRKIKTQGEDVLGAFYIALK
ncbi:MAG: MotA/TolQ/ExbB proton channel family protein [Candidatus Omnitrophica bacterium]|nr:MotA/TolQ/ExbB proton channel family protein [Candidatus Omnitrophota bacterium]